MTDKVRINGNKLLREFKDARELLAAISLCHVVGTHTKYPAFYEALGEMCEDILMGKFEIPEYTELKDDE